MGTEGSLPCSVSFYIVNKPLYVFVGKFVDCYLYCAKWGRDDTPPWKLRACFTGLWNRNSFKLRLFNCIRSLNRVDSYCCLWKCWLRMWKETSWSIFTL